MAEQQQQQHPNKLAFEEGVTYIFKAWTALKLAVEQEWGGIESAEKRDWMIETIVDYFGKHGKKLDVDDVEPILEQIMADEFQTILEDDSAYQVAKHLVELFRQCIQGNFTEVERLRAKYGGQRQQDATTSSMQQPGDDSDEDDDDDDDIEDDDDNEDEDMEMDEAGPSNSKQEPEIDDDGFQTVRYNKRR
ncbi:hypothetical protein VTP01DRAFT_5506 [Rhizomucor pusillus]|uniref:uncharacterized protein n=1 Tax=Rhizomucor pusillus TaxID=4840 RepID=UPI0037434900